jgi:hypothetical protein
MKKNYLYLILVPFLLWVLDEIFIFEPSFFFISLSLGILLIVFYVRSIAKTHSSKFWPLFVLPPVLFYAGFSFYSAIIVSQFWMQAIFLLIAWFIFSYLQNIYYYFFAGTPERESKLHQLLLSGSFLAAFAIAATLYALPIFLSWPFGLLILLFVVIAAALFGQFLIFAKNIDKTSWLFWGINIFILAEFAGILFLLPLNYNVLGLLLAIVFYFLVLFDDWRSQDRLFWKNVRWPIIITSLIFALILLSARWL